MGKHRDVLRRLQSQERGAHTDRSRHAPASCAAAAPVGEVYNIGGGETANVWEILRMLEPLAGRPPRVVQAPVRDGDQRHTGADTAKLFHHLGWQAKTRLADGLARQWEWQGKEPDDAPAAS